MTPIANWPDISRHLWRTTFRWGAEAGIAETWDRVAQAVASRETDHQAERAVAFRHLMDGFAFLPAERILAGAGTDRQVTSFNCCVMGEIPDTQALRDFNRAVPVTDEFMAAVRSDADCTLVFPAQVTKAMKARELWERILRAAYDTAEPVVLFVDQINRENNLHDQERLTATNPCGETPLPAYGVCDLGSLNLTAFVIDPFEPSARIDFERLEDAAKTAVRFLDNVIDISAFPLPEQAASARATRRIGLGITGLADVFAMLGHRYDGWTARGVAEEIVRRVCTAAYGASIELARERGPFPTFCREAYLASRFISRLPAQLRDGISAHGIRNSHLLAIAPAGTISLLAGNVSSGIEPIFALESRRKVLDADGDCRVHLVPDFAYGNWQCLHPDQNPPPGLVTVESIDGRAQLDMQATLQPWIDNAISMAINVPADMRFDEFRGLYELAFERGLQACTVFRPTPVHGTLLTVNADTASRNTTDAGLRLGLGLKK